jgi:hypothetical protein
LQEADKPDLFEEWENHKSDQKVSLNLKVANVVENQSLQCTTPEKELGGNNTLNYMDELKKMNELIII